MTIENVMSNLRNLTWDEWMTLHAQEIETDWERRFARHVLSRVAGLSPTTVTPQRVIHTSVGKQLRIDFAIEQDGKRIAVEVDGYDKTGSGTRSRDEFKKSSERDMELRRQGWHPFHVANSTLQRPESRERIVSALEAELGANRQPTIEVKAVGSEPAPTRRWSAPRRVVITLVAASAALFFGLSTLVQPDFCSGGIAWSDAEPGQPGPFYGRIVDVHQSDSGTSFLDIGKPFPDRSRLRVVIFGAHRQDFPVDLADGFLSQEVCVHGSAEVYEGITQVTVNASDQVVLRG